MFEWRNSTNDWRYPIHRMCVCLTLALLVFTLMCDIIDHPDLFFFFDPVHPFLLCIEALVEDDPILFQPPLFRPSFSGFSYVCLLLLGCAPPFRKCEKPLRRLDAHFFAIVFSVCPFIVYESVRNCRQTIPVFENCE